MQVCSLLEETRSPFLAGLLEEEISADLCLMQEGLPGPEAELLRVKEEVVRLRIQVDEMKAILKKEKQVQPDPRRESRLSSLERFSSFRHIQSWLKQ